MSVKVNDFLARVTQIYTESPKYVNGGYGNDGTCASVFVLTLMVVGGGEDDTKR